MVASFNEFETREWVGYILNLRHLIRPYWDMSKYGRISSDMVGYNTIYLNISRYGMISPNIGRISKYTLTTRELACRCIFLI
jgi:hypothetical protein